MICDLCGEPRARIRRVTRSFGEGNSSFLIRGVPVVTCAACGESYLTAETLKEIERIRSRWRELSVEEKIPVAKYD